jgi:cyclophilin family peptidyl-prolyl cis-trans isomerase
MQVRFVLFCALVGALFFAACGSDDDGGDDGANSGFSQSPVTGGTAITQPTATARPAPTTESCGQKAAGDAAGGNVRTYDAPPEFTIDQNKQYFATIEMDIGNIKLELYPKEAPCHVNSFVFLARDGYYDGVGWHRVLPGFVAQAGDPTGTGSGGPGYTVPLEVNIHKHVDGALGMARTNDPNSAGSQFFIDYGAQPNLDSGYTVFGQVIEGREVLDQITPRDPSKPSDRSITPTKINTITIEEQ